MGIGMRMAVTAALLACLNAAAPSARAAAISNDQKLQDLVDSVAAKYATLELAAEASQRAGQTAISQQQFLLHDIVKRANDEIKYLEHAALTNPVSYLDAPILQKVDAFGELIAGMDYANAGGLPELITAAQARANAMVDSFPEYKKYPILYGMLVRDLMDNPAAAPADVEIFGHNIVDPTLGKAPLLKIMTNPKTDSGAIEIPANLVKVSGDDILVDLPDGAKETVRFAPSSCEARNTFLVRALAYYGETHGIWPVRFTTTVESNSDFHALPSARIFDLGVEYEYDHSENLVATEKFSDRSDYVVAECGQTAETSVKYTAPAGGHDLTCGVSWAETSGSTSSPKSCSVDGNVVTAKGSLTGPDRVCSPDKVCGCVTNARGWLQIDGVYKRDNIVVETKKVALPNKFIAVANTVTSIPIALASDARLKHVGVVVNRRACPVVYDRLDVQFNSDGQKILSGASKGGSFRAEFANGTLNVINATSDGGGEDESNN